MAYNRIVFPDRAENMKNSKMKSYKVFLDYMDDFIKYLKASNEKVSTRGTSFALAVYGEQGIGKTLLAGKIKEDFEETKSKINRGETIKFDNNNIWHRITGSNKSINNIIDVTNSTDIYQIYEDSEWVQKHKEKCKNDRQKVIIIDNAEKAYFGASLIGISEDEFFAKVNEDNNMLIYALLAQKFVSLARNEFSNTLFIILANRKPILQSFFDEAQKIHEGMVVIKEMPRPSNDMKEKIVRTNINRLNPISYWD